MVTDQQQKIQNPLFITPYTEGGTMERIGSGKSSWYGTLCPWKRMAFGRRVWADSVGMKEAIGETAAQWDRKGRSKTEEGRSVSTPQPAAHRLRRIWGAEQDLDFEIEKCETVV